MFNQITVPKGYGKKLKKVKFTGKQIAQNDSGLLLDGRAELSTLYATKEGYVLHVKDYPMTAKKEPTIHTVFKNISIDELKRDYQEIASAAGI